MNHLKTIPGREFLAGIAVAFSLSAFLSVHASAQTYVVEDGSAKSVIVLHDGARGLYRYSAEELQKYVGQLTGVRPEIISPQDIAQQPQDAGLLLVGGPEANELVKKATQAGMIDFSSLRPEGFLLKTLSVEGRQALVIGGNDEAGTLYAAYDWLEQQGVVFQITDDIIPNHRTSLLLSPLDVRSEPTIQQRGYVIVSVYEMRSIWSYPDIVKFIDQMAKLKLNYLVWHMFSPEPYLEYSYRGEKKRLGDTRDWQGGYLLPTYNFGRHQVEDYFEGKDAFQKFGKQYMAPDEWQGVQDEDQVYARARDLLQRVIHYAKTRNVKVWIALESLNEIETNMARFTRRIDNFWLPFNPFHGTAICPTDPSLFAVNELRFKALLTAYPEAEGYIFWMPEHYDICDQPKDKELFERERSKYQGVETLIQETRPDNTEPRMVDNSIGMVHLLQKILEIRDQIAPKAKLGVGMWGRAFLLPTLDRVLPKDVSFLDLESSGIWTFKGVPMKLFGGMGERERTLIARLEDDSGMVGMQFHTRLYYHDRLLEGALENQVTGLVAHGEGRFRGEEHLAKYLAEGAWNPHLTPDQFYRDYSEKSFGQRAAPLMFQAFMALENKEAYGGYHCQKPMDIDCCGPPVELLRAKEYAEQPNPYDGPDFQRWKEFVDSIPRRIEVFAGEVQFEEKALESMKMAEGVVAPGSLKELHYLENKTQSHIQLLRTLIQLDKAFADFSEAFQWDSRTQRKEFLTRLDESFQEFHNAQSLAHSTARTFSEDVDNVSDLGVLWRLNVHVVAGMDLIANFMDNINNYHHGKPYLKQIQWERVFSPLPVFPFY